MSHINDEQLDEIQCDLEGTCKSLSAAIEDYGLEMDEDALEDRLLDGSRAIETCGGCGWWFSVSCLEFDEEKGKGMCDACSPELHDS